MGIGKSFFEVALAGRLYHTDTDSTYDADSKMKKGERQGGFRLDIILINFSRGKE